MVQKKICLLGSSGVGKTSIVNQYLTGIFSIKYHTSIGVKVDKKELQTDKSLVQLMIWDLEGIDLYCGFKPKYLRGASAYIVVADQTNSQSLVEGMDIQRMVKEVSDIPGILAINKSDLSANWQWSKSDIQEIKQGYNCSFDTSAKTGLAVESMFTYIATILTE